MCSNVNCTDTTHCEDLCAMYDCIVGALYEASRPYYTCSDKSYNIKQGWNKFVAAHMAEAKEAFKAWVLVGRPRQGPDLNLKKITNASYKYSMQYVIFANTSKL